MVYFIIFWEDFFRIGKLEKLKVDGINYFYKYDIIKVK